MKKPESLANVNFIDVGTRAEAWEMVNIYFGREYKKDENLSLFLGRDAYEAADQAEWSYIDDLVYALVIHFIDENDYHEEVTIFPSTWR